MSIASDQPEIRDAGPVPAGWARAAVTDLVEIVRGVSYAKGEAASRPEAGRIALLRANNIGEWLNFDDLQYVPEHRVAPWQMLRRGDVIVAMSSGSKSIVGKAASLATEWTGTFGAFCGVLRPHAGIDSAYMGRFFQTKEYRTLISAASAGTNINNLKREYFESIRVPVPPLAEQKRIVAKVDEVLARVNAARERLGKVPTILKRFRQSVLAAAFSGRLTADWRASQPTVEPVSKLLERLAIGLEPVRSDLDRHDLPQSWAWTNLRTLMSRDEPFCYGVVQPGANDPEGVFLVRAGDLEAGSVNVRNLRRIPCSVDEAYSRSRLRGGELLVTVVGAGIGESSIAPNCCRGYNVARAVAKIPIRQFSARYVWLWLQSQTARGWMDSDAREVARPTLNLEQLETLPVPVAPEAEQHQIDRIVTQMFALADRIEARVTAATLGAEKLVQATLAKAFRGELVPTEAELAEQEGREYETAEAMLERIRRQRAEEALVSTPRKRRRTVSAAASPRTTRPSRSAWTAAN